MKNAIAFFIENYKVTVIFTLFLVVLGTMGLLRLNAESYPAVNFATAIVTTRYDGAAPEDIETKITRPIEDEIRKVKGLKDVRSISQTGLSKIVVRVDMDNVDAEEVIDDLQKAVERTTDLPADLRDRPVFVELNSEEFPAIELAVIGTNDNRKRDLLADRIKDDLEDHKDVLSVRLSGYTPREFNIRLSLEKLMHYHIGVGETISALQSRNVSVPAGNIYPNEEQKLVRLEALPEEVNDLKDNVIRSNFTGQKVLLKDIATVKDTHEKPQILAKINGKEATLLTVTKKAGADTLQLVEDVQAKLAFHQSNLEDGFEILIYNNEAKKVKNRVEVLTSNALSGLVLVVFFLLLFLPGRIGIMASLSLPLAILTIFGFMPKLGMNLDTITILAMVIALGMLVDNSVVISENYARLRKEGMDSLDAAIKAAHQFWPSITATAMTTIAAFLPMLVTKGIMGEFIKYIPIIVTLSLLISLVESFFLLPMRLHRIGRKMVIHNHPEKKNDWFDKWADKLEKFMILCLRNRYKVAAVFTVIIVFSFYMLAVANKFILFPPEQTEIYVSRFETPRGSSLNQTYEAAGKLSQKVKDLLGDNVESIVARAGVSQVNPNDPKGKDGDNVGMLIIYMTRKASFELNHVDVLKDMRKISSSEFLKTVSYEALVNGPPVGSPIDATIRGNDQKKLEEVSSLLAEKMRQIPGVLDIEVNQRRGDNQVKVHLNYEKISRLGLSVADVGRTLKAALDGHYVTKLNLQNKKVNIKVELERQDKSQIENLARLSILDRRGNLIPLAQIAEFEVTPGTPIIKRFDFQRSLSITGDVNGEVITSVEANKALFKIFREIQKDYPQITLTFGGEQESTKESMSSLKDAMFLALIAIFAILVLLFRSYLSPLLIMSTIPLGLLGLSVAFYFHDRPISFLAMIGVIGLSGIIVNSGIVLISFIEELRAEGKMPLHDILALASKLRLRAVVVTSLTTISGLFPTAYGIGGHDSMLIPMTLAMAWGLTSGTILTLMWIPCAYAINEDIQQLFYRLWHKKEAQA